MIIQNMGRPPSCIVSHFENYEGGFKTGINTPDIRERHVSPIVSLVWHLTLRSLESSRTCLKLRNLLTPSPPPPSPTHSFLSYLQNNKIIFHIVYK